MAFPIKMSFINAKMIRPSLYRREESFLEGCPLHLNLPTNMLTQEHSNTVLFRKTSHSIALSF